MKRTTALIVSLATSVVVLGGCAPGLSGRDYSRDRMRVLSDGGLSRVSH